MHWLDAWRMHKSFMNKRGLPLHFHIVAYKCVSEFSHNTDFYFSIISMLTAYSYFRCNMILLKNVRHCEVEFFLFS